MSMLIDARVDGEGEVKAVRQEKRCRVSGETKEKKQSKKRKRKVDKKTKGEVVVVGVQVRREEMNVRARERERERRERGVWKVWRCGRWWEMVGTAQQAVVG